MASSSVKLTSLRIGDFVLRYRAVIGGVLLIISAVMAYYCTRVTIATKFDDFFPASHPNVQLYEQWHRYGGAQTLSVMIQVKDGDGKVVDAHLSFDPENHLATLAVKLRPGTYKLVITTGVTDINDVALAQEYDAPVVISG